MTKKWTTRELQVLRDLYPLGGTRAVYEALKGSHSIGSIRTTAWNYRIFCEVPNRLLRRSRRTYE